MDDTTIRTGFSPRSLRIGVFDSGLGGLSVLRAIHARLPEAALVYVADSGHAPYGERSMDHAMRRSERIAEFLHHQGADALVIACNTATAIAAAALRDRFKGWPIVGVEPGVKPAVAATRNGRIGVMATTVTLESAKFKALLDKHGGSAQFILQPCPGLAAAIESGDLASHPVRELVQRYCEPLRSAGVDTVVLGCTHYPFVAPLIADALPSDVTLIDTAEAVARQTAAVLDSTHHAPGQAVAGPHGSPQLFTTGSSVTIERVARHWLPFDCSVGALQLG